MNKLQPVRTKKLSVQMKELSVLMVKANRLIEIPDRLFQPLATSAHLERGYSILSI